MNRIFRAHWRRILPFTLCLLASPGPLRAETVAVPVHLDNSLIRQLILTQVYQSENQTARLLDETPCSGLVLSDPQVASRVDKVRFLTRGEGHVGIPLGEKCLLSVEWSGMLEVILQPVLLENSQVQLQVVDSDLYDIDMQRSLPRSALWKWISQYFYPRLEHLRFNLGQAVVDLRNLLPSFLAVDDQAMVQKLLVSFQLTQLTVTEAGIEALVQFDLPEATATPAAVLEDQPEPVLTEEELLAWEQNWQAWDAFVTFIVKQAAEVINAAELREEFLDILLQARHELTDALSANRPGTGDPVRTLFVHTWQRLAPLLRQLSPELPGDTAFGFLSFIAAGDALALIDSVGPGVGLEISTDGLRRLARLIQPTSAEDPVQYDEEVDPEIRDLFDFGPPLPSPEELEKLEQSVPESETEASEILPILGFFMASARAESTGAVSLNNWVPTRSDVDSYAPRVLKLLNDTAARTLAKHPLDNNYRDLYRSLVLATAWQESCWRQFIRKNNQIVPIRSSAGAVGMMQVMPKVWRGFYDPRSLESDIAYNAAAGSEILAHYLIKYAIARKEHEKTGNLHFLARATYSAYNGGPGQLSRYRTSTAPAAYKEIDQSFWSKYQAVSQGEELGVIACYK